MRRKGPQLAASVSRAIAKQANLHTAQAEAVLKSSMMGVLRRSQRSLDVRRERGVEVLGRLAHVLGGAALALEEDQQVCIFT
jgi:hypothetical protein